MIRYDTICKDRAEAPPEGATGGVWGGGTARENFWNLFFNFLNENGVF